MSVEVDEDDNDGDAVLRSVTDLGVRIRGATKRASWSLAPGARAALSTASDADNPELRFRFNGSGSYAARRSTLTAGLSVIPEFTSETQFEDTGNVENDVLQISINGNIGFSHSLDARNRVTLGASAGLRTFTDETDSLDDTRNVGINGGWSVALTPRTNASLSPSWRYFESDEETGSDAHTLSLPVGFDTRVNERLSMGASLGPSISFVERRRPAAGGGVRNEDDVEIGWVGGFDAAYRLADTAMSVRFDQSIDQDSEGDVNQRASLSASLQHTLTSVSRVSLSGRVVFQDPLFGDDDRITASLTPTYSYDVTEDWSLSAGWRIRARRDDDETNLSNLLFLRASRDFDFLQ